MIVFIYEWWSMDGPYENSHFIYEQLVKYRFYITSFSKSLVSSRCRSLRAHFAPSCVASRFSFYRHCLQQLFFRWLSLLLHSSPSSGPWGKSCTSSTTSPCPFFADISSTINNLLLGHLFAEVLESLLRFAFATNFFLDLISAHYSLALSHSTPAVGLWGKSSTSSSWTGGHAQLTPFPTALLAKGELCTRISTLFLGS